MSDRAAQMGAHFEAAGRHDDIDFAMVSNNLIRNAAQRIHVANVRPDRRSAPRDLIDSFGKLRRRTGMASAVRLTGPAMSIAMTSAPNWCSQASSPNTLSVFLFINFSLGESYQGVSHHLLEYSKLIQSSNGHRGEYGIVITLAGVPVAARFNQTVCALA
jgi:hypothetical protein